jgi:hypothetical protein
MDKNIPIYKLKIKDSKDGVDYVALVDYPAIEKNFVAFNKHPQKFEIHNEDKKVLMGPLMIANLPIYRKDPQMGEYYAIFDSETIEEIVQKFFKNKNNSNVNRMHNPNQKVDGVYMYQSWIIDREKGVHPPSAFNGLSDGSWFGMYKVENDEVWNDFIKSGELKGFSIEGLFEHEPYTEKPEDIIQQIIETIEQIAV